MNNAQVTDLIRRMATSDDGIDYNILIEITGSPRYILARRVWLLGLTKKRPQKKHKWVIVENNVYKCCSVTCKLLYKKLNNSRNRIYKRTDSGGWKTLKHVPPCPVT